jgi:SHS2 domain-containing protein
MKHYEVVDHGADIGIKVSGRNTEELFEQAAYALMSLIVDVASVEAKATKDITIHGGDELLILFLNELLYIWDAQRFIPKEVAVEIKEGHLRARIRGEPFDAARHAVKKEIKAVTYHGFEQKKEGNVLTAKVILDV